ncbi:MAG: CoA transferase, partial [Gammaproteobacteria bacterium]|nr:CoA transferase [Gammaproteobacteria bacterium]
FATSDGHVLLHVVGNGMFGRLCRVIGRDDWPEDPTLQSDDDRGLSRDRLCEHLVAWCGERSTETVLEAMGNAGVPCGPVLTPAAALHHPQVEAMEILKRVSMPGFDDGIEVVDFPVTMSGSAPGLRQGIPGIGVDADGILEEIGYSGDEIAHLRSAGAI